MRYLILLLVLANVAFFVWYPEAHVDPYASSSLPPEPPRAERLVLLSERPQAPPEPEAAVLLAADIVPHKAANGHAPEADKKAQAKPEPEPEPQPEPPPPPVEEKKPLCRTIGPYFSQRKAKKAISRLTKAKYKVSTRNGNIQAPAGYWVYLPTDSAREARKTVADLDKRGMTDYFIGKDNIVSLGIFSKRASAVNHKKRINDMGYSARMDQRYRTRKVYWLDLEDTDNPLLVNPLWQELLKTDPDIAAQQVSCE
jgi:hypothetical protein